MMCTNDVYTSIHHTNTAYFTIFSKGYDEQKYMLYE